MIENGEIVIVVVVELKAVKKADETVRGKIK